MIDREMFRQAKPGELRLGVAPWCGESGSSLRYIEVGNLERGQYRRQLTVVADSDIMKKDGAKQDVGRLAGLGEGRECAEGVDRAETVSESQ